MNNTELENRIAAIASIPKPRKPNPLMEDDDTDESALINGWKSRAEELQTKFDVLTARMDEEKSKSDAQTATAKALVEAAIAMVNKAQEMFQHKDFRTTFAIAESQGFKFNGPLIQEPAQALVKTIGEFQKAWDFPKSQ